MIGPIEAFMTESNSRLDRLLSVCDESETVDERVFAEMKRGLLRHIALEEKILLRDARVRRSGKPLSLASAVRRDHAQIVHELSAAPSVAGCNRLRLLLSAHNPIEEGPDGLYATCDRLASGEADRVVACLRAYPGVAV